MNMDDLDEGDVVVRVVYTALNYKDGLAAGGHPGVARKIPLVPGIDAVGEVVESASPQVTVGDQVLIAHAKFGTAHHGGFAAMARVPADWVYPLRDNMTMVESATWGTAGFTAAQSVEQLLTHGVGPESGEILVTGATGGVGIFAVQILANLGFQVVASSGKPEKFAWLQQLGATEVISRSETVDGSSAELLKGRWAGIVDTVGGTTLSSVIRAARPHACVTACGMVAGHELGLTVYPFILRGVTLCGIDSANLSWETRSSIWARIASEWKFDVSPVRQETEFQQLPNEIEKILAGKVFGRVVVKME